jgi:hypothetical protein
MLPVENPAAKPAVVESTSLPPAPRPSDCSNSKQDVALQELERTCQAMADAASDIQ